MDIRKLHSFVKIVDIGSITRASAILHIAQPALSQQVAALESHYGKPLLVRSKRGVVPTEAGKVLYRHSQMILRQMEEAELDIQTASEGHSRGCAGRACAAWAWCVAGGSADQEAA